MILQFEPGQAAFVRFECGCVGLRLDAKNIIIITSCDSTEHETQYMFYETHRDFSKESFVPLEFDRINEITQEIGQLVIDGYKYRDIKRLLTQ